MNRKLITCATVIGALALPLSAYSADSGTSSSGSSTSSGHHMDSAITAKVKAKFAKEKGVSAMHIKVSTDDQGVVTLSGTAKTKEEAEKAVTLAKTVDGVTSVQNDIQVNPDR